MFEQSLHGIFPFITYFTIGFFCIILFMFAYYVTTNHNEFKLLKEGNVTAAVAFGGAIVGYSMPLSAAIKFAATPFDCAIWAMIGLIVQLLAYFICKICIPNLSKRIESNELAAGVFVAALSIAIGIISLASMSLPTK